MPVRELVADATGITGILSVDFSENYAQAAAQAVIECTGVSLDVGDTMDGLDFGWADDHEVFLTAGIVKKVTYNRPQHTYTVQVHDRLSLAVDYFMASDDPDSPFLADNVEASALVGQLLAQAGLTSYSGDTTAFTFATQEPTKINLISAWDAIENICRICGMLCYMQSDGTVRFTTRKPYLVPGDTSIFSLTTGASTNIEEIEYERSDENLRNRVVVYGGPNNEIHASASADSPYLPEGFFKTIVVAHELISTEAQAQATAELNLTMFNRPTENLRIRAIGNTLLRTRAIVDATDSFCNLSGVEFVIYGAEHNWSRDGYSSNLVLVK